MVVEKAYAKINLTLSVGNRRFDGYHDIDTVMHAVDLYDVVTLAKAKEITLDIIEGDAPAGDDNLMFKAARTFFETTGLTDEGVAMTLAKRIPSEAGLGGGSADAAAVLRGLNNLYGTKLSMPVLATMAKSIGADVPFCVWGGAARCQGIGEKMTPLDAWVGLPVLIVKPPLSLSTTLAYQRMDELQHTTNNTSDAMMTALENKERADLYALMSNDFEDVLCEDMEELREVRDYLKSVSKHTLMTGSGSSFFLVFDTAQEAQAALHQVQKDNPTWFAATAKTIDYEK